MRGTVFLIDDDSDQLALLTAQLERSARVKTRGFTSAQAALGEIADEVPDAVVCDLKMPGMDGIAFTQRLRERHATLPVIILTARGTTTDAESALSAGATDFVTKPFDASDLAMRIKRSMEAVPEQELLAAVTRDKFDPHGIIGAHPLVQEVRAFVRDVAAVRQVPVLLLGESGTGKNLVARAVHGAGEGSRNRFVEISCAAIPSNLLEAELFGYEKGAFTDARQTKKGLAEIADRGTLFLDELGTIPPDLQAKLLTFLESRSFRRIGGTQEIRVDVRVIAATNVDLAAEVARGNFREDLYYRLNVASHVMPPLRRIRSDIPAMTQHFARRAAAYFGMPVPRFDAAGLERLQRYDWPGNARELRNTIERAMIFSKGPVLEFGELAAPNAGPEIDARDTIAVPRGLTLEEVERLYIEATMAELGGSVSRAAEQLGITRKVLWQRRKQYGLYGEDG